MNCACIDYLLICPIQAIVTYLQLYKILDAPRVYLSSYPHLTDLRVEGLPNTHIIWHHHSEEENPSPERGKALLVWQLLLHRLWDPRSSQDLTRFHLVQWTAVTQPKITCSKQHFSPCYRK